MKLKFIDNYIGKTGEKTNLQDINGDNLFVGDVVRVISNMGQNILSAVVKENDKFYVMGLKCIDIKTTKDFKVYKEKSYASMKVGEKIGAIEYVDDAEKDIKNEEISPDKALKALIGILVIADILGIGKDSDKDELEHN